LYSGCGRSDVGCLAGGCTPIAAFESDPNVASRYCNNLPAPAYVTDLSKMFPAPSSCRNVSAIIAGPPCQGFSVAGLRNPSDPRNKLLPLAGELSVKIRPLVVVVENVPAARCGEHAQYWVELETRL